MVSVICNLLILLSYHRFDSPRLHQTSPRLRLAGQIVTEEKIKQYTKDYYESEVCAPKLARHGRACEGGHFFLSI